MKKLAEKLDYLIVSFRYAMHGIGFTWKTEQNFRTEIFISLIVIIMMLVLPLRPVEQLLLGLLIVWVLTLELINTVLERTMDVVKPKEHPRVQIIKDVMAAAVLVSAAGSAVIGIIIFYPYWANLLTNLTI